MHILDYYPPVVKQIKEIQQIAEAEEREFSKLATLSHSVMDNMFISTADENGVGRFEKIAGIVPDMGMTLEERKMYILSSTNKCKMTLLELMFMLSSYYENISLSCDYNSYELFVHLDEYVTGTRAVYNILDGFLPLQVYIIFVVELIVYIPEEMDITKINMHTQLPFWACNVLNGTRLLDGTVLLDDKRRYDLVLGIKNGIKIRLKETMDTDRVCIKILSCFNVHESTSSLKAVFKLGRSGFWEFLNDDVHLKMVLPVHTNVVQDMEISCIANGSIKVRTEEKTGVALVSAAAVNFWEGGTVQVTTKAGHRAVVQVHETIGDVAVAYRRNLYYTDGSVTLDGSRLLNAFYGKEDI
ncbi:MAG: DUF2313 domain-containing protein [Lachnospiraceae bacterium]|nr:DUF2313 domain-containing protein [Lachnospiraceae bacterium]